jgi:outer membrane protein assembly factor BamB
MNSPLLTLSNRFCFARIPVSQNDLSKLFLLLICSLFTQTSSVRADDWPQWRGKHRDGISQETGLLKEWPKEGPKLQWQTKDAGSGYSTPAVVGERLYLLGNEGLENEFVEALSAKDGKRAWSTRLGKVGNPDQQPQFPAARSTPTVEGEFLYALGSDGDLACVALGTGKIVWHKNLRSDFGGKPGIWAYSESPLVDGDVLICTPGGAEATLVALNKKSGEVIWKCPVPGGDEAAYASPIIVDAVGTKQYVQVLDKGLVGVEAKTGKFLWRYDKIVSRYRANIPTPVAHNGQIYSAGVGTGGGSIKLKSDSGAIGFDEVYFSPKLPTSIGGDVKVGDRIYGTTGEALLCVEFATGNIKWDDRALGAASLCYAEDKLYLHGENGEVGLVEASADGYHEKGRFAPPEQPKRLSQMEKAWTYPVVANGHLYIRDHNLVWCYNIKAGK